MKRKATNRGENYLGTIAQKERKFQVIQFLYVDFNGFESDS